MRSLPFLMSLSLLSPVAAAEPAARPNVLFIAVDDLNDWVGCLGGHPQARTPHIDRLAAAGMLFANAHCAAPICNASRTSVLTGRHPATSGVHGNEQDWRQSPWLRGHLPLGEYFRKQGYWTGAGGKIFHANHGGECAALNGGHGGLQGFDHPESWTERFPSRQQQLSREATLPGQNMNGLNIWHWDWGPLDVSDEETTDGKTVHWAAARLQQKYEQPFFLAVGIYRPHSPWYVPRSYFEQHPLADIQLPEVPAGDLEDVPAIAKPWVNNPLNDHRRILDRQLYPAAVQAYLANVAFADAMVGRLLQALEQSPHARNTVVVLWSDHGWHLGEKQKWHKSSNWEEATRVPLIVVAPGLTAPGARCDQPVSLIDLYPTLLELCGLPAYEQLDGESLVPLLRNPATKRARPAVTTQAGRHHSVRTEHWRYIRYDNGAEELYDHRSDPGEHENLARREELAAVRAELKTWIPREVRRAPETQVAPYEAGFRPLFNGYDLTGWEGDEKLWQVREEMIVGVTTAADPLPRNSFLIWKGGTVRDFELRFQAKLNGRNNSGVQYRSRRRADLGQWGVSGYQADIHPAPASHGMLYEEQGRGVLARAGQRVILTGEGQTVVGAAADQLPVAKLSEWNDYVIIARGSRLIHQLNGVTVVDVDDRQPERSLAGLLALQLHRGQPMEVCFRHIRLKDFGPTAVAPLATAPELPK